MRILTINPGSTSTKVAVFDNQKRIAKATIKHDTSELLQIDTLVDQLPLRQSVVEDFLDEYSIDLKTIDGFIGRGGLLKPLESGLYEVNPTMIETLSTNRFGVHASNLGGLLAHALASKVNKKAYIADPVVVDEMRQTAKISGLNGVSRRSLFHALNQKAVARKYAEQINQPYEKLNLIVAHLGGGISVGYHHHGRVVDVNNALDGDGPMSPERTGSLPVCAVIDMAYSCQFTQEELLKTVRSYGGMFSYLNTKDAESVSDMIASGSANARKVFKAMVYQIAQSIGALYGVSYGNIDTIILTGGLAYNADIIEPLKEMIKHMAPVVVYPGENELEALAFNMQAFLESKIPAKLYQETD